MATSVFWGMSKPVNIEDIFTFVSVSDSSRLTLHSDSRALNTDFVARERRFGTGVDSIDSIDAANRVKYLQLIGAPGSGKSTALKQLAAVALAGLRPNDGRDGSVRKLYQHRVLPVFVELSRVPFSIGSKDETPTKYLEKAIVAEMAECGITQVEIDGLLAACRRPKADEGPPNPDETRVLFLLDGLDEVHPDWTAFANTAISDFASGTLIGPVRGQLPRGIAADGRLVLRRRPSRRVLRRADLGIHPEVVCGSARRQHQGSQTAQRSIIRGVRGRIAGACSHPSAPDASVHRVWPRMRGSRGIASNSTAVRRRSY